MRNPVLSRLFSTLFAFVLFPLALFAAEPASAAAAGTPAVPAVAPENVFFKVSLNESFFIQEREAVVNARCTVDLLQGTPDVVSLEVFGHGTGQGEIFNVSGEKVRDWSIRRAGARTFLEIRPKDLDGVKSFSLTISGRQPLKLPTTISPMLFSGADAATFFGVVQFLATADLRLYAKQERGLVPIGERSRSEIGYGIIGAPSLRLDIARTNDLLAPVSLENFSLVGDVGADGTRFRMKAKAFVREIGAEVPVLTGNVALLDFPEKNDFVVLAESDEKTGLAKYLLRFPSRGEFDVDLQFDAGISDVDGWRRMNFSVPVAQVAPYSLKGMPEDTVFAADNVSIPQAGDGGVFSGFLPSSGALELRWRPSIPTPPEFSASVYALDAASEMRIFTGVLRQKTELNFSISQGELSSLFLKMTGTGEILAVEGQDLLSWRQTEAADGSRGLTVQLSQPKSGKYALRILSQTRTGEFPKTLSPLRFVPSGTDWEGLTLAAICVRSSELLRLRSGVGIRCEAVPQLGMTQVVASAFPRTRGFFDDPAPGEEVAVYRISDDAENLRVRADRIRSELVVKPRVRWIFDGGKTTSAQALDFEVRDVPLYEMQILVPEELEMIALNSEIVASHELRESEKAGYRLLKIVFSEPVLGAGRIALTFRSPELAAGGKTELRACLFPQARFVFGVMGLSAAKNVRLLPGDAENLTEIAPAEYGAERPPQLAFYIRDAAWKLPLRAERREPALVGASSCVYNVGSEKVSGNFRARFRTGGVPVSGVRLAFPKNAKALSVSGENVRDWSVGEDGVATVAFAAPAEEDFSVSATFEEPRAEGNAQRFEGVALPDALSEEGTILITSDEALEISGEESGSALAPLPLGAAENDYFRRGGALLFRAYQFAARPFSLNLETRLPQGKSPLPIFVTEALVRTGTGKSCSIVYRCRSLGAKELRVAVPAGTKIVCEGARALPDGTVALPLPPNSSEIRLRTERADAPSAARETEVLLPRVFAPVARTVFKGSGNATSETMRVVESGRKLNDALDASLLRRVAVRLNEVRAGIFAALLLAGCAAAGAAFASRARSRKILCAAALLGATAFSALAVWSLADAVRPEYAQATLSAGLTDPGKQLDATLRHFFFFCGHGGEVSPLRAWALGALFCPGFFLLLWGKAFRPERMRLRVAGRALLYLALAVPALEDFPCRVPMFVAAAVAAEALAFGAAFLLRLASRAANRRGAVPPLALFAAALLVPALQAPEARAQQRDGIFSGLETLDEENAPAAVHDVADRITQSIDVRGDRIVARGDIRVTGYAGDRFDLLAAPAVLTSFEKAENSMLRLERRRAEKAGFVYQVVLERAGTFSATFSYELALAENARGFPMLTGFAAADVATLHLPRAEVQISAKGAVTTTLREFGEKAQIAQIVFKPKAEREILWNPRERDRSGETLQMFSSAASLYVPSAGVVEGRHVVKFTPAQGEVSRVRIGIPKPFSVSRIEGQAIHRWSFSRETGVLTVLFTAPRVSEFSLSVFTQAQLGYLPTKRRFSAPDALDCDVQVRTIGIATDDSLQVDAVCADGLVPIDEKEFFAALAAAGMKTEGDLRLRRAFRTVDGTDDFEAELSVVQPNLRIDGKEEYSVNGDAVRAKISFTAKVSRAEIFSIAFRIPAGTDVDAIRGDSLSYWSKTRGEDGSSRVTMHLKNELVGAQEFTVWLSGAFPQKAKEWTVPDFVVEGAKVQRGEILVSADEGLRLQPLSSGTATFSDEAADGSGDVFCFRYFNRAGSPPKFAVLESKPFMTASWLHRISPRGRYALSSLTMILDIENAMRSSARVRVPENALAVRFSGDEVVSASPVAGTPGLWELRFSKPLRGKVFVDAEYFSLLPAASSVKVHSVAVDEASRQAGWIAVERGPVFTALDARSPETSWAEDVPAEFNAGLRGGKWIVEKYSEQYPAELRISPETIAAWNESPEDAHRRSFLAESLRRFTVFSASRAITEERISLRALRSDVFRVALPEGGTLKAAAVNGKIAEAVPAPEAGGRALWIPIFERGGAPVTVSVVYEAPTARFPRGGYGAREIVPAETVFAERISWTLLPLAAGAEISGVFGLDASAARAADDAGAEFLAAYFRGSVPAAGGEPASPATFAAAGEDCRRPSAVFVCAPPPDADPGNAGAKLFAAAFVALAAAKGLFSLRRRRNARG